MFRYFLNYLGAYYAQVTGIPLDKHCTEIQQKFIAMRNREQNRRLNGNPNPANRFREPKHAPILAFDGELGAALDEAFEKTKSKPNKKRNRREERLEVKEEELDDMPTTEQAEDDKVNSYPEVDAVLDSVVVTTPEVAGNEPVVETAPSGEVENSDLSSDKKPITISDPDLPKELANLGTDAFDSLSL